MIVLLCPLKLNIRLGLHELINPFAILKLKVFVLITFAAPQNQFNANDITVIKQLFSQLQKDFIASVALG